MSRVGSADHSSHVLLARLEKTPSHENCGSPQWTCKEVTSGSNAHEDSKDNKSRRDSVNTKSAERQRAYKVIEQHLLLRKSLWSKHPSQLIKRNDSRCKGNTRF